MAPKSLKVWLADYIWEEISHVITWKHDILQGIKADPDGRFHDDGSNFRCLSLPPSGCDVQLIQVLSTRDTVTGFVSDGATRVKAQFSDEAVASFEEATDESLDVDVTGDVFQIKKVTVISTPFGPADGFVQLYIEELQYKHHLRKTDGAPTPIEDDENIRLLIDNIKNIRVPPIKEEPEAEEDIEMAAPTLNGTKAYPTLRKAPPVSIEDENSPYHGLETQVPRTQVKATKSKGPSLSRDGFEIKQGVNLAQPTTANYLLNLMDKGKSIVKPTPSSAAQPKPLQPPSSARPSTATSKYEADVRMSNTSPEPQPAPSMSNQPGTSVVVETPVKVRVPRSDNLKYGRRKIPENQRRLLEKDFSWHPVPPGRTRVHPNVPIELLTRWNAEEAAAAAPKARPKSQTSSVVPSPKSESAKNDEDSSSDASDSSSEDELIPEEDWPASQLIDSPTHTPVKMPTRKRPPPSSATDQLEVAAPQTLPREPRAMRSPANMARHLQHHPSERVRFDSPSQHQRLERQKFMERERRHERESKQSGFGSPPLQSASEHANTHRPEMNTELKDFYDQYLKLGEENGNAFSMGKSHSRVRTRTDVDVLSWNFD